MMEGENGEWTHDKRSDLYAWLGGRASWDWGHCQINDYWHPDKVNDDRFFTDWKWQLDQCLLLWNGGTRFYATDNIPTSKTHFEWKEILV